MHPLIRQRIVQEFSTYLAFFYCGLLACMASTSFATESTTADRLGALFERRRAEMDLAHIEQYRKPEAPAGMYWREKQPFRAPMSDEDRQVGIREFQAALEENPIDWNKIQSCLGIFLYDKPDKEVESLLIQTMEKFPSLQLRCFSCPPQFVVLILSLGNQETEKSQAVLLELIAPDFEKGFKLRAAKHCYDLLAPEEYALLSEYVAGNLYSSADLDFANATLKKALERLPKDSALTPMVVRFLELLAKKMEGDPNPDGNTP